jgi:hypothetical protein
MAKHAALSQEKLGFQKKNEMVRTKFRPASLRGREACLLGAAAAVAALMPGVAHAQTLLLDITATKYFDAVGFT